jgi:hypothetical protein
MCFPSASRFHHWSLRIFVYGAAAAALLWYISYVTPLGTSLTTAKCVLLFAAHEGRVGLHVQRATLEIHRFESTAFSGWQVRQAFSGAGLESYLGVLFKIKFVPSSPDTSPDWGLDYNVYHLADEGSFLYRLGIWTCSAPGDGTLPFYDLQFTCW